VQQLDFQQFTHFLFNGKYETVSKQRLQTQKARFPDFDWIKCNFGYELKSTLRMDADMLARAFDSMR